MQARMRWTALAACVLLAAGAVAGCGSDAGDDSAAITTGGTKGSGPAGAGEATLDAYRGPAIDGEVFTEPASLLSQPAIGPSVIKTAALSLDVERDAFGTAVDESTALAERAGGYVVETQIAGEERRYGRIVVRVPAARFGAVLEELRALGDVKDARIEGRDVSAEFVDLEARKRNLHAQEVVLLRLMSEAVTVTDTIQVQNQLQRVQGEVEQIEGRLRYLRDQARLSTITLSLHEAGVPAPSEPGAISEAFTAAKDRATGVITATIEGAGFVLPTAALGLLALLAGRAVWRRIERGHAPPPDAPQEA